MTISVGVINDHPIVTAGLTAILAPYPERVRVEELEKQPTAVDVVLYDPLADPRGTAADTLLWQSYGRLVATGWDLHPVLAGATLPAGVEGYICLRLRPAELVEAIEHAHRGELITTAEPRGQGAAAPNRWPGEDVGLSERGSDVLVLVCHGLGNAEIADALLISVNTVKTYIRATYRRIGATTRPQAVIWGIAHGLGAMPATPPPAAATVRSVPLTSARPW